MVYFNFNMRKVLKFLLLTAVVFYLLDAGVDAGKSRRRRKKDRRSKRTDAEKEARRNRKERKTREENFGTEVNETKQPFPTLVQLLRLQQLQGHKDKLERPKIQPYNYEEFADTMVQRYMDKRNEKPTQSEEIATVLPVVNARVDFLIKREKSKHFYEPDLTTSSVPATQLGLVTVHSARGKYGLHSRPDPVFGRLIHVIDAERSNSNFGCGTAIANKHEIPQNGEPWIALIQRGHCAFFRKIKLAERNNASAVIIYDHKEGEVPKMNTIGTNIVSLAISKHDGRKVARLADSGTKVVVNIDVAIPTSDSTTTPDNSVHERLLSTEGNSSVTNNGAIITTLFAAIIAVLFQTMTS
ncbi:uncharacterized protein LOC120327794 [Styela clava]